MAQVIQHRNSATLQETNLDEESLKTTTWPLWSQRKPPPPTRLDLKWHFLVEILAFTTFLYVFWAYLNATSFVTENFPKIHVPYFLCGASYAELLAVSVWALWRGSVCLTSQDSFRIVIVIVSSLLVYAIIPLPAVGGAIVIPCLGPYTCTFPATHTPGSLTFFLLFGLTLLFGRRADCGYCCTCVSIRETVGYSFRHKTLRHRVFWVVIRHLKWVMFTLMILYLCCRTAASWYDNDFIHFVLDYFWVVILIPYYGSLPLTPLMGNRNFCRWLCPFGAMYGIANKIGFFKITANHNLCIHCRKCESVCDMGVPIEELVMRDHKIKSTDCMGCGRCVDICPKKVLQIEDCSTYIGKAYTAVRNHL